ncbi:MAG TPA: hypothetical protein VGO11_12250 [Chthoniobacteraceae bacterium]|nr:hypothetical protein [Chthoniobacteraceae bacterium]
MAHLWLTQADSWQPVPLAGSAFSWSPEGLRPLERSDSAPAWLRLVGREWVLLAAPGLLVNGAPLRCGVRVLRDRDELRFAGGTRAYFSSERLAAVQPFAGHPGVRCPRCRQAVDQGALVVVCPACGAVCHQTAELGCFTYGATCPLCDQPSALDAGYRWTPEEPRP